jgi:hypothetical protein
VPDNVRRGVDHTEAEVQSQQKEKWIPREPHPKKVESQVKPKKQSKKLTRDQTLVIAQQWFIRRMRKRRNPLAERKHNVPEEDRQGTEPKSRNGDPRAEQQQRKEQVVSNGSCPFERPPHFRLTRGGREY